MSYILDALKKSDQERKRGEVPTITSANNEIEPGKNAQRQMGLKVAAGGFALGIIIMVGVMFIGKDENIPPQSPTEVTVLKPVAAPEPTQELTAETKETAPEPVPAPATTPENKKATPLAPIQSVTTANPPVATPAKPAKPEAIEKPAPIIASDPVNANIPKANPSATEAPPPASQPIDKVSNAPAPKRVPGSSIAQQPQKNETIEKYQPPVSKLPPLNRASDYLDRGWSSLDRGLFNQAVADFSAAVKMEPGFVDGWFALGWAQEKNEQYNEAIASYTRTIKAKADHTGALFSRGYLELFSGNPLGAANDFNATLNLADGDFRLYTHAWLFIARTNADADGKSELIGNSNADDLSPWPGPIIKYFAGNLTEAEVLQSIESGSLSGLQERRCAGYFFLGEYALLQGNKTKARDYFEKSLATGVIKLRQFDGARRELAKLAK